MKPLNRLLVLCGMCALGGFSLQADEGVDELKNRVDALRLEVERLRGSEQRVKSLESEVAELRAEKQETWMTERRREEIKALIHEVLADAETRGSFSEGGLIAGWNKHFFLASEDGNFLMTIAGQIQTRYIINIRHEPSGSDHDDLENGFQMRRAKANFQGHVFDPKLQYNLKFAASRDGGEFDLEDAYVKYEFADGYFVQLGQFKPRFSREDLVSSTRQQAVERSTLHGFFRLSRPQAAQISAQYERWNWALSFHDGREANNLDFTEDNTHFAFAGRAEYLLAGEWKQFRDYVAWSGAPFGVMLGGGLDFEETETGRGTPFLFDHFWQWTADVSVQWHPFNLFIAGYGRHVEGIGPVGQIDQFGLLVQAGAFIVPDKLDVFGRWEMLDHDGFTEVKSNPRRVGGEIRGAIPDGLRDEVHIFTFGTNYYFTGSRDVKLTFDVVWMPDGLRQDDTGGGLLTSTNNRDQIAIRTQLQLLF